MKKFITEESFWSLFPDAEIGVVVLNDVDNSDSVYEDNETIRDDLAKANQEAGKWITATPLSKNEVIKVWRDAFQKFKKKKGNYAEEFTSREDADIRFLSTCFPRIVRYAVKGAAVLRIALYTGYAEHQDVKKPRACLSWQVRGLSSIHNKTHFTTRFTILFGT